MSPVIKYDVSKVDPEGASTPVKPGTYKFKIKKATHRPEKNDIQVVATITAGKFKGVDIFTWVNFGEASEWKLRQFTDALGLKPRGSIDPDKLTGKTFTALTERKEFNAEMRNGIKTFLKPAPPEDDDEPDEADIEEEDDDEDEDDATDVAEDDDDDDDEEDDDEEEEDEDEEDFESMDDDELREEAEARGLKTTGSRKLLLKRLEKDAASSDKPF